MDTREGVGTIGSGAGGEAWWPYIGLTSDQCLCGSDVGTIRQRDLER